MPHTKVQARLERLKAERLADAHNRLTCEIFTAVTRDTLEQIEAERRLYAFAPPRSEVLRQLITEGLAFRRMHRPSRDRRDPSARRFRSTPPTGRTDKVKHLLLRAKRVIKPRHRPSFLLLILKT